MKSSLSLTTLLPLLLLPLLANSCSTQSNVAVTFYGYPDNDPPGPATAYNCGSRNYIAGGTGTYADPLTFATDSSEFNVCEIIYLPYLQKYLRMEDDCVECDSDWSSGNWHIDIWTGSSTSNGGSTQITCEDNLTPNAQQTVLRSPPSNLAVDSTALFSSGSCRTSHVYNNPTIPSCSGSSSGGGTCSWAGHCLGASCSTDDDCSDVLICTNGQCANP